MATPEYDLSPAEAAEILGVHVATLKRWAIDGKVGAFRTPTGWWKFRQSDLDALIESGRVTPSTKARAS